MTAVGRWMVMAAVGVAAVATLGSVSAEAQGWGPGQARPRPYPEVRRVPYPDRRAQGPGVVAVAFDNGYADGYQKGLDDGRDRRSYDPIRHRWYRDGDRHYNSRYGLKARYQNGYRDGFRSGYDAGYRAAQRYDARSRRRF